jgi:CubicO group peptidase (beta-lactamase class C family)
MTLDTTMMAYSMTKTITAVAILQLVERGRLRLDEEAEPRVPGFPYGSGVTVRQLLAHTAGIPNPIPLRWAHLASEDGVFDEAAALAAVLRRHPRPDRPPGRGYAYSNIGYWILGRVLESAAGQSYVDYVRQHIASPLGLGPRELGFSVADPATHAGGYLLRVSMMNLFKGLVTDRKLWGHTEGKWLRFQAHNLDGPAFGGLIGTARAFARFLQDQLRPRSVLLDPEAKLLLETPQENSGREVLPMTLGWHVRRLKGEQTLYKEGGGGGFHCEMRLYPSRGIGTVVMANDTGFRSTAFLDRVDTILLERARR